MSSTYLRLLNLIPSSPSPKIAPVLISPARMALVAVRAELTKCAHALLTGWRLHDRKKGIRPQPCSPRLL